MYKSDENLKDRLYVHCNGTCCELNYNEAHAIHKLIINIKLIEGYILQE